MRRRTFNELSFEPPAGWQDASTLVLVGPEPEPTRTLTSRPTESEPPNLVVRRQAIEPPHPSLDELIDVQEQGLRTLAGELKVLETGELQIQTSKGPVRAVVREYSLAAPERLVHQLHVYFMAGGQLYAAVGTGPMAPSWKAIRDQMLTMLGGLEVEV